VKQIIIFPKGQLNPKDRTALEANDFIPLEVDDPQSGAERMKFASDIIDAVLKK
jgi:hypothetical protein